MRFCLIRHCTTQWNSDRRIQGRTDTSLHEIGREEARSLSQKLRPLGIQSVITSTLRRARETGEIIAAALGIPLESDSRLCECSFGTFEGLERGDRMSLAHFWTDEGAAVIAGYDFRPFGGENRDDVIRRHLAFLDDFKVQAPEAPLPLLVGHGRGLKTLLAHLGLPPTLERGAYTFIEY